MTKAEGRFINKVALVNTGCTIEMTKKIMYDKVNVDIDALFETENLRFWEENNRIKENTSEGKLYYTIKNKFSKKSST
jgi:hypothetical protein